MARKPPSKSQQRLHWHPDVHLALSGRRLYFWFFRFRTNYPRDEVLAALKRVGGEVGITSFATYELIGPYDILARFYMRPEEEKDFEEAYERELGPYDLSNTQPFRVADIPRNWVWAGGPRKTGSPARPKKEALQQKYSRAQLELVNQAEDRSRQRQLLIKQFSDLKFVTRQKGDSGVKFVATIGTSHKPNKETRRRLWKRLETTLDNLSGIVMERSLYAGDFGQHQLFLVMCRIKQDAFHKVRNEFLEPLGQAAAMADASTTTYPVVSDDLLCFEDRLAVPAPSRLDAVSLLEGHEDGQFEVKGSLTAPLDPWIREGIAHEELPESDSYPIKGVLKSVVGLLNSGGGTVVVGAVEERIYGKDADARKRLQRQPLVGQYRIVGLLDPTFRKGGWDRWDRQLRSLIREKIDPNPGVLVEPRLVEVAGRTICVIDIDDPGDEGEFYLRLSKQESAFFGREGTQVHRMNGTDIRRHLDQVKRRRVKAGRIH